MKKYYSNQMQGNVQQDISQYGTDSEHIDKCNIDALGFVKYNFQIIQGAFSVFIKILRLWH